MSLKRCKNETKSLGAREFSGSHKKTQKTILSQFQLGIQEKKIKPNKQKAKKNPNNKEKRQKECLSGKQPIWDDSKFANFGCIALCCCCTIIHAGLGLALAHDTSVFNYT